MSCLLEEAQLRTTRWEQNKKILNVKQAEACGNMLYEFPFPKVHITSNMCKNNLFLFHYLLL